MTGFSSPSGGPHFGWLSHLIRAEPGFKLQDVPMPPRHPAPGGGRQRPLTASSHVSPTSAGLTATRPRQTFEWRRQLHPSQTIGSEVLHESDREDDCTSRSGQPSPAGSLEARQHGDSVGLLSPPSSQPSRRASLLQVGSRSACATSLTRISSVFRSCSRSRNIGTGSGSGSGGSSPRNSHVSVSSASLALGPTGPHSLIQALAALRDLTSSSPPATGAVLPDDASDADGSEGALRDSESHTFGLPVVGGAASLLPRGTGVRGRTHENDPGRSSVSVSSSSSPAAAASAAFVAAMSARVRLARGQVASPEAMSSSSGMRSSASLSSAMKVSVRGQLHSARWFVAQRSRQQQRQEEETPPSPSILSQSVRSEDTTGGQRLRRR